jgi:hypothetical protein
VRYASNCATERKAFWAAWALFCSAMTLAASAWAVFCATSRSFRATTPGVRDAALILWKVASSAASFACAAASCDSAL